MSSLSNLPYGKILDYWYERLKGKEKRWKFILTKVIEIYAFTKHKDKKDNKKKKELTNLNNDVIQNKINTKPNVSVIIPTYIRNDFEKQSLIRLVKILTEQEYKINEIILVDDCSPVDYEKFKNVTILKNKENGGPAIARNKGIQKAIENNADIIAFTDVDCVPDTNWILSIVKKYQNDKSVSIVSGNTKSYSADWFSQYHEINGTLNGRVFKSSDNLLYGTTANLAITREVAEIIRFNEKFPLAAGEDIEFCFTAIKKGFKVKHCKDAIIYHDFGYNGNPIKNMKRFMNQFSRYAKGEKTLLELSPDYYEYFNETIEIQAN